MASMRDIKRRKASITSTQQITKAMKLVATVKLQQARTRAEQTDPYFQNMYKTVQRVLGSSNNVNHPYLKAQETTKKAIIVITSNRGLAGGYNSNIAKLVMNSDIPKEDVEVIAIGNKGRDLLSARGYHIMADHSEVIDAPEYVDAMAIAKDLLERYSAGEIGEIDLCYTHFKNTVVHEPQMIRLLPMDADSIPETEQEENLQMNFEPTEEEALELIIPKYVTSLLYGAMVEALASENGARMQAMDSATENAEEMIDELTLKYNQARQGSITQELTEIISGAEALS